MERNKNILKGLNIEIKNLNQLYKFILANDLSQKHLKDLLHNTLGVWVSGYYQREELVDRLKEFLIEYPIKTDRPIFLDVQQNKIKVTDFDVFEKEH